MHEKKNRMYICYDESIFWTKTMHKMIHLGIIIAK